MVLQYHVPQVAPIEVSLVVHGSLSADRSMALHARLLCIYMNRANDKAVGLRSESSSELGSMDESIHQ